MEHLMQEVGKLFDEFKANTQRAITDEIKDARKVPRKIEIENIWANMPSTPMGDIIKLFNDARERLENKYRSNSVNKDKKGLFSFNKG